MEHKYKIGDKIACVICCGGQDKSIPAKLLGEVVHIFEPTENSGVSYHIRLPSGMMDVLTDKTART